MLEKYICPGCNAEYDSLFELSVRLVRIPDKSSERGYFCPKCGARIALSQAPSGHFLFLSSK